MPDTNPTASVAAANTNQRTAPKPVPDKYPKAKRHTGLKRLLLATSNSLRGFKAAFRHEVAFRQEVACALIFVPLALFLGDTRAEQVLLAGSVLLVLVVELLNSAIETVVDRVGLERHDLSGRAKDLGSAAVLLTLITAFLTWGLILL